MSSERFGLLRVSLLLVSFTAAPFKTQVQGDKLGAQEQDEALTARFLQEAPVHWKAYAEKTKQLQGSLSSEIQAPKINGTARNAYDLKRNANNKLIVVSMDRVIDGKKDYDDYFLLGLNPDYAFELRRVTAASPWVLAKVVDLRSGQLPARFQLHFEGFETGSAEHLMTLSGERLEEVIRKPEFRVLRCRAAAPGGEQLVEVDFDYTHETQERGGNPVQAGTLVLDPQRFWCLRSYQVRTKYKGGQGTIEFNVLEFGDSGASFPVAKRTVSKTETRADDGKTAGGEIRVEYDLRVPRRLPGDEEFRLSAFGLPEPRGMPAPTRSYWYIWLGFAGLGSFLLAVLCRKGARHWRERAGA